MLKVEGTPRHPKEDFLNGQYVHEKCSTSLAIPETKIKTTLRYHFIPTRMAIIILNNTD